MAKQEDKQQFADILLLLVPIQCLVTLTASETNTTKNFGQSLMRVRPAL